jgi:hypothetical protein
VTLDIDFRFAKRYAVRTPNPPFDHELEPVE